MPNTFPCAICGTPIRNTFFAISSVGRVCPVCWSQNGKTSSAPPFQLTPPPLIPDSVPSDEWYTPQWLLDIVRGCDFDLDPCSDPSRDTPCRMHMVGAEGQDGLAASWRTSQTQRSRVWLNPPYSALGAWTARAAAAIDTGEAELVVMLIPFRPEGFWHDWIWCGPNGGAIVGHPRQRIVFEHPRGTPGSTAGRFPSAIVILASDLDVERYARRIITCGFIRQKRDIAWIHPNVWR